MIDFLTQDYGGYIWSSVLLTVAILVGNAWAAYRQLRAAKLLSQQNRHPVGLLHQ